ncbi:MAG: sugar nucleotide-binding protein, partial [Thermodesulfovibrionales bacterium]|nr:sugar nucleotide-binding protein [Thermodesulfovibrionales bacterium]
VVDVTMKSLKFGIKGTYHLVNSDFCSRYEWACFILKKLGINKHVHPVSMSIFNLPAKRPSFSSMSNKRICSDLNIEIPSWKDSVEHYLNHFIKTS